jgi:hypothetical protein
MNSINAYVVKYDKGAFASVYIDKSLRWCSDGPVKNNNDNLSQSDELSNLIDMFIDKHLWYLPLPRFSRTCENDINVEVAIKAANYALKLMSSDNMSYIDEKQEKLVILSHFFLIGWPHLTFLKKQGKRLLAAQSYVVCLMALNPKIMSKVSQSTIDSLAFIELAQQVICEEINPNTFLDGPADYLNAVSKFLALKAERNSEESVFKRCPRASLDWLNVEEIKTQNLLSHDIMVKIDEFKNFWTLEGLNPKRLEFLYIKNILDECPEIGILGI